LKTFKNFAVWKKFSKFVGFQEICKILIFAIKNIQKFLSKFLKISKILWLNFFFFDFTSLDVFFNITHFSNSGYSQKIDESSALPVQINIPK